ncbi:hypothetical protein [Metabacillus halosaccharovorans]|uniref:hypothetical protein n=1 Tax=Metabacillus halosaccharovorans TaxID=930124 RepID=UPI00203DCB90|nr:hypothetical protein [Metabacillus halosaccharovorans]MCM3440190.1 hypothetical protein [Metabacillus halosaccharovorans]
MRKFWFLFSTLVFAIGLTACAGETEESTESQNTKSEDATAEEGTDKEQNAKSAMMRFYMSTSKAINEHDGDLNAYEASEEEPTVEMKTSAEASAKAVVEQLKTIEIPEELADQKADLESAIEDLTASYQTKADELAKDAPSLDAANETFTQADEKLGKVFEDVGLIPTSLSTEVND